MTDRIELTEQERKIAEKAYTSCGWAFNINAFCKALCYFLEHRPAACEAVLAEAQPAVLRDEPLRTVLKKVLLGWDHAHYDEADFQALQSALSSPLHQPEPAKEQAVEYGEVEIGWRGGMVTAGPFIHPRAVWTPDQADQVAEYLKSSAQKARAEGGGGGFTVRGFSTESVPAPSGVEPAPLNAADQSARDAGCTCDRKIPYSDFTHAKDCPLYSWTKGSPSPAYVSENKPFSTFKCESCGSQQWPQCPSCGAMMVEASKRLAPAVLRDEPLRKAAEDVYEDWCNGKSMARLEAMLALRGALGIPSPKEPEDDDVKCEGCDRPATTSDGEGNPLCAECQRLAIEDSTADSAAALSSPLHQAEPAEESQCAKGVNLDPCVHGPKGYISTYCLHGLHGECRLSCKICHMRCHCWRGHVPAQTSQEAAFETARQEFERGETVKVNEDVIARSFDAWNGFIAGNTKYEDLSPVDKHRWLESQRVSLEERDAEWEKALRLEAAGQGWPINSIIESVHARLQAHPQADTRVTVEMESDSSRWTAVKIDGDPVAKFGSYDRAKEYAAGLRVDLADA